MLELISNITKSYRIKRLDKQFQRYQESKISGKSLTEEFIETRALCITLVNELHPSAWRKYHPRAAASYFISSHWPSLTAFADQLKFPLIEIKNERTFLPELWPELQNYGADHWISADEGFYIKDIPLAIQNFITAMESFLNAIEPADSAEFGYFEYIRRTVPEQLENFIFIMKILVTIQIEL